MSRRSLSSLAGAILLAGSLGMTLAGCSTAAPTPTKSPHALSRHSPHARPSATPSPTPTFVVKKYTCTSILSPPALAEFQKTPGFTLQPDFTQRVHNFSPTLSLFDDYGGILCQWAYPEDATPIDYGFSPITASEAETQQATLQTEGYAPADKDHGIVMANTDTADYPDSYLFINGYWFYASKSSLLDLIVDNVFSTSNSN